MDTFVYGTLTDPEQVARVVDSYAFVGGAVVSGLHPVEGRYPTLAPGGEVAGRVLRTDDVDALDRYEGVDAGLYVRVTVPWADPPGPPAGAAGEGVAVYVGDPARLGVEEAVDWPGEGSLRDRVEHHLADAAVSIRPVD
ncbi:gamma-glutamylcyclotransferase [Halobium salinum]|uniref:Gamma-glutamylcyclotransferase n=1 Tax=Halobium salinum TaxID=1364940 RepID=A0ABD5PC30_9EURY|nr:gamma-glutamylcyclotransferase family protein [Halobium salinum]